MQDTDDLTKLDREIAQCDLDTCKGVMRAYYIYRYYLFKEKYEHVGQD